MYANYKYTWTQYRTSIEKYQNFSNKKTAAKQIPWDASSLTKDFYFEKLKLSKAINNKNKNISNKIKIEQIDTNDIEINNQLNDNIDEIIQV